MAEVEGREDETRAQLLAAFDSICPGIVGNPYIPHWPTPPQQLALGMHLRTDAGTGVFELLYGGAAGGGKSDFLLMAPAQQVRHQQYAGLVVRRTYSDLAKPGAIMDRAHTWWRHTDAHWDGTNKVFRFPSGAKIQFSYMQNPGDELNHKSAEYQDTLWDELTELANESQYSFVGHSRVRRPDGSDLWLRTLGASNPGGPGHDWVKARFIGDPEAGIAPLLPGRYVPARIRDNPYIDQDAYIAGLMHLHPTVREQMLNGDWRARDPGDYFRREWFGPLLEHPRDTWPSSDCVRIRWWDLAASVKPSAARTAGVRMARHRSGVYVVEHVVAGRWTPGTRDDVIVQTAKADGPAVTVGIEIEPGSGGIAQYEALASRLSSLGFRVKGKHPRVGGAELSDREDAHMAIQSRTVTGKEGRADPVASCLEKGYQMRGECPNTGGQWWGADKGKGVAECRDGIRLFAGDWTQRYLDELEGFPPASDGLCDQVDATSGAWAWLRANRFGASVPLLQGKPQPARTGHDVHPEERDRAEDDDKTATGRWRAR